MKTCVLDTQKNPLIEYPQHLFWLRNKKNNYQIPGGQIIIWGLNIYKHGCVYVCVGGGGGGCLCVWGIFCQIEFD